MTGRPPGYFRVAVVPHNFNFEVSPTSNGSLEIVGGYEAQFLDMLSRGLGLKPLVYVSEDGEWGRRNDDGTWTGLIGMVLREEVDMAISSLLITETRLKAVDFSYPYFIDDVTFATKFPGTYSTAMAFVKPFSLGLWICLIASIAVFSLVFCFLMSKKISFHKTMFILLGYVLNQPSDVVTQKLTDRILIGAWMCGTLFLSKIYSSFLLSFLTLPIKQDGIKDISQLAKAVADGSYKSYTTRGTSIVDGLSVSEQENTRIIITAIKDKNWLLGPDSSQFAKFIRMDNSAIIRPRQYIRNVFQDDVFVSDDSFYSAHVAIVLPKNSPLKLKTNHLIHKISASAIYARSIDHYLFNKTLIKNARRKTENGNIEKIDLEDLKGAILLLISGYLLSLVACVLEIICKWKKRKSMAAISSKKVSK